MSEIVVVIPSRGRPRRASRTIRAIRRTAVRHTTHVVLVVDEDDPTLPGYRSLARGWPRTGHTLIVLSPDETGDLVRATNTVSMRIAEAAEPLDIIANLGDDHIPRTRGWDRRIIESLSAPGIAYGDDRLMGEQLPTAPFISVEIVRALGWYALPTARHLFIDTVWLDLGRESGTLHYLPDVVIEHVHPLANKADWDEGYRKAYADEALEYDRAAYDAWRTNQMASDVARIRALS